MFRSLHNALFPRRVGKTAIAVSEGSTFIVSLLQFGIWVVGGVAEAEGINVRVFQFEVQDDFAPKQGFEFRTILPGDSEIKLIAKDGKGATFVDEGKTVLVEEFGRDYGTYFAILSGIACGKTTFAELKNLLGTDIGGYLTKLERDYSIISQTQPIFERSRTKNCHYRIDDCFFRFWFRFVYRNQSMIELGRFRELQTLVARDIDAFSGYALERYFRWKFTEDTTYTRMGGWWDRKGENEIDLVCEDEINGRLDFYEVKRDAARIDLAALKAKTAAFFEKNPDLRSNESACKGLSLADV